MKESELIAEQALKISELEKAMTQHNEDRDTVYNILYCIGGPLNDNKQGFTKSQLRIFFSIRDAVNI